MMLPAGTTHFAVYVDPVLGWLVDATVAFLRDAL